MKWVFAATMLIGPSVFADTLFIIHRQSGFVAAEAAYRLECQVNDENTNRVWSKGRDSANHAENKPTVYSPDLKNFDDVRAALEVSAQGTLQRTSGPTDRPTSRYYGILEGSVVDQYVKLLIDQSVIIDRNAASTSDALLRLADLNCPLP